MRRLTDSEIAVMDHFSLTPNIFGGEGAVPGADEVLAWCKENGILPEGASEDDAQALLDGLDEKFWGSFEYDSISIEDTATWVLSHSFTEEQLLGMKGSDVEEFLKNWKYHCGFRKCDGWGDTYKYNALSALSGEIVLDERYEDYTYISAQK